MKTLRTSVTILLSLVLPCLVLRWDRRRLTPEQRARAWGRSSWEDMLHWCNYSLNFYGVLPIIGWIWVTRQDVRAWRRRGWGVVVVRSLLVLGAGLLAAFVLALPIAGVDELIRRAVGAPD